MKASGDRGTSVVDVATQCRAIGDKILDGHQVIVPLVFLDLIQRRSVCRTDRPVPSKHDSPQPKVEIVEHELLRANRTDGVEVIQAGQLKWSGKIRTWY